MAEDISLDNISLQIVYKWPCFISFCTADATYLAKMSLATMLLL